MQQKTVKVYFLTLQFVPLALIIGPILFLLIVLFLSADQLVFDIERVNTTFLAIAMVATAVGIFGGNILFNQLISSAQKKQQLSDKATSYFTANLVKFALLEGVILLSIVFVFLTANLIFLLFWGFLLLVQITSLPSKAKFIATMQLSRQEMEVINDPTAVL